MTQDLRATLDRIDKAPAFGTGRPTGEAGDDRRGHYWLVTEAKIPMAVKVALITGRPLLVEGPSGSGKSALARAVSETLGWTFYETVVTSQTRLDTLTGWVDLVQRLHQAEVAGRAGNDQLAGLEAFVQPGVLWWALDPDSAVTAGQGGNRDPGRPAREPVDQPGAVVLLDEIDKAEPDLPNNLLVPLGSWELQVEGRRDVVELRRPYRPLVFITSNGEREMPPAFLRRCVVLELDYPSGAQLVEIARQHVTNAPPDLPDLVRRHVAPVDPPEVSPAEFVDAVRAAAGLGLDGDTSADVWDKIQSIVLSSKRDQGRG